MGIDEPEENATDTYERGRKIVPECIKTNDNEIPVKQYNLCTMQTKIKFMRAEGRLQVTNQRVIFRATGRSLRGRTTLQHHFNINDISGLEARKDYRFAPWSLILGGLAALAVAAIFAGICLNEQSTSLAVLLGIGGLVPFFVLRKKFFLKLLSCGVSYGSLAALTFAGFGYSGYYSRYPSVNPGHLVLFIISIIVTIAALLLFAFKPNLVFNVKMKSGTGAIDIARAHPASPFKQGEEHTGFEEVLPWEDTELAIREVGAIIHDIQMLGKLGVDKWINEAAEQERQRQKIH